MDTTIFPEIVLNTTEEVLVATALALPAVKKYFHSLANQNGKDIVFGEPFENESAESYLRRQALVKGRLEVLQTLLSIEPAVEQS